MAKPLSKQLVVCVNNDGYPVSLEKRKIYVVLRDPEAERSAACCGLSTNPEVTTFIEKHSSARSRCPNQSRKQFWPLLDGSSRAAQRKVLSRSFRLVGTNEKVRRNLPRFADLVDHLDRECAAAHQNFRYTRPRAEEVSKFCLSVTELLDGIMQHIDRIEAPVHFDR